MFPAELDIYFTLQYLFNSKGDAMYEKKEKTAPLSGIKDPPMPPLSAQVKDANGDLVRATPSAGDMKGGVTKKQ